tara:strand:+ start:9176 stop:9646 length:471 start_codon:yes stop_codon:yes gene_type:complete
MLIKFLNCFIFFSISFSLIFFPVAHADNIENEIVVSLEAGQPAPFGGTLFSTAAAAKLLAEIQLSNESCQVRIDREIEVSSLRFQLDIDNLNASLGASNLRYDQVTALKDNHIDFLDHQLQRSSNPRNELWLAIGITTGLLAGMGAAWSYGQIANN